MLPVEILELIPAGCYFKLSVGLGLPRARDVLRDGGLAKVLETVLANGADIRVLLELRNHIASDVAICKAVRTKDALVLKRVCIMWGTWFSIPGYKLACDTGFKWGALHLKSSRPHELMNALFLKTGEFDKIQGTVRLSYHDLNEISKIEDKRLLDVLTTDDLLYVYCIRADMDGLMQQLDNDLDRKLQFEMAICLLSRHKFSKLACDLYQKYGHLYWDDPMPSIIRVFTYNQDAEGMKYLGIEDAEIHEAIFKMGQDKDTFNKYLRQDRQRVLDTLELFYRRLDIYDPEFAVMLDSDLRDLSAHPEIELGDNANWVGLDEISAQDAQLRLEYRYSFQKTETRLNMIMAREITNINSVVRNRVFGGLLLKPVRTLVEVHGRDIMRSMEKETKISITKDDWEDIVWFINLCADLGYRGVSVDRTHSPYLQNGTVYYSGKGTRDVDIALRMYYGEAKTDEGAELRLPLPTLNLH